MCGERGTGEGKYLERERVCVEGERAVREERESAESEREIPVCVGFCGELRGA